ncbi:leucine-rich repeats and immunoglobulin-like domains protein sma-10 [Mercenaria mercenaria]|uniref:leucine-rich repeats and immunoglobulin-like domains protein sma-10 n=1 Tax=Mercenaria mercenaria TaxID=6596 RepID=UPI00234EBBBC|nr:leucine-rich repeats and immunoglobulin-like domains protein sma-10 [Mercenaria mercenaria]
MTKGILSSMKLLFYLYALSVTCKMQDMIAEMNVSWTTDSYVVRQTQEKRCDFANGTGSYALGLERNTSGHGNNIYNNEILVVNVSSCGYGTVQKHICNLCSLPRNVSIDMSWNNISMLDDKQCNCPVIKEMDFSNNELTVLRANTFVFIQYVERINMSGNHIYQIQQRVFNKLRLLEVLDLSNNALRRIHLDTFDNISYLRILNLSANKIHSLRPGTFSALRNLEELDLSNNDIYSLNSGVFKGLENLRLLNLAFNKLTNPKLIFLFPCVNLSLFDLSGNNFVSFGEGSLNVFHIYELFLNNLPRLRYITNGAFRNGGRLTKVDLSRNKNLIFIEEYAFQNMQDYITYDISFTLLKSFPKVSNNMKIKATETPLRCECTPVADTCSRNDSSKDGRQTTHVCGPSIVSQIADNYFVYVGQRLEIDCFAVGEPKPRVTWERIYSYPNGTLSSIDQLAARYFLNLYILSLNFEGKYRCVAMSNSIIVHKNFNIYVKQIDIGIKVLSRSSHSILVAWNKTQHAQRHVLLHRAFETTSDYIIENLNEYWKVFIVRYLQPFTEYEICIASFSDINDKSCVRVMTLNQQKQSGSGGIRHNNLAITFLALSGVVFGVFILATMYRCLQKIRIISRQNIFIVASESRECFANVTESTFTYENHNTELLVDTA